MSHRDWSES